MKIFLFSILFIGTVFSPAQAANLTEVPTGMTELKDFRYPVYLFAPENFSKSKDLAMILVLPGAKSLEDAVKEWSSSGASGEAIVVAPEVKMRDEDVPYKVDQWLLKLKNDLVIRYGVDRVYLVGLDTRAHYATYLGMKYPKDFDGVVSVGGSWSGPFEKLTKPTSNAKKQAPFLVAIKQDAPEAAKAQKKSELLTAKGYSVRLVMLEQDGEENTETFRSEVFGWFEKEAAKMAALKKASPKKSFKEKVNKTVEEFFAV